MRVKKRKQLNNAFTIAEALLASVILAIAAGSLLVPFTAGASASLEGRRLTIASNLASSMMERLLADSYDKIISDGLSRTEDAGQLRDSSGNLLSGEIYLGISRDVDCREVYLAGQRGRTNPDLILISVTVCYNGRELLCLDALKGR